MIGVVLNGFSEQPSVDYERYYGANSEMVSGTQIDSIPCRATSLTRFSGIDHDLRPATRSVHAPR